MFGSTVIVESGNSKVSCVSEVMGIVIPPKMIFWLFSVVVESVWSVSLFALSIINGGVSVRSDWKTNCPNACYNSSGGIA